MAKKKAPASPKVEMVPLGKLRPHPLNRKEFNEAKLDSLAESIGESQLTPLIARPHPDEPKASGVREILAGHRRFFAAQRAKGVTHLRWVVAYLCATQSRLPDALAPKKRKSPTCKSKASKPPANSKRSSTKGAAAAPKRPTRKKAAKKATAKKAAPKKKAARKKARVRRKAA